MRESRRAKGRALAYYGVPMSFALPVVAQLETAGTGTVAGLWASRLGTYLALTVLTGLLVTAGWLVREGPGGRLGPRGAAAMRGAAVAAGAWAVAAGGMLVFGLANATARPVAEVLDTALLERFLGTRYGVGVALQVVLAVGVCMVAAAARDRAFARVPLVGVVAGAVALASAGHAGTAPVASVAVASSSLHVLAAAAWAGGLAVLVGLVVRGGADDDVLGPASRFSRLAGWALGTVLVTGAVNTLMHVDEPGQLLDTSWGRMVLVKMAAFAGIAWLGWWNRRRLLPRIRAGPGARRAFGKVAAAELGVMLVAFASATALASGTPAAVEEAARLATVRVGFADGQVELTLSPARAGVNELHVYFFDATGGLRPTDDVTVTFSRAGQTGQARLLHSGPGHYTGPAVSLPAPGAYQVEVAGAVDGQRETTTTTLDVR